MENRGAFLAVLAALLLLLTMSSASARDYSINTAIITATVAPDGIVHMREAITYVFDGEYNEVFRDFTPPEGGSVRNISGSCVETECETYLTTNGGKEELVAKIPRPMPKKLTFLITYEYWGGIVVFDDVSELHFKPWGDEWERPAPLQISIVLPEYATGNKTKVWLHPEDAVKAWQQAGNKVLIQAHADSYSWFEARVAFPRLEDPDPSRVSIQSGNGMERILKSENAYVWQKRFLDSLVYLMLIYLAFMLAFPFIVYFRYGREPKIDYRNEYEREILQTEKPAIVNAITSSFVGQPNINGFVATLMDLATRGVIALRKTKSKKKVLFFIDKEQDDIEISFAKAKKAGELAEYEQKLLDFLKPFAKKDIILWSALKKELSKDTRFYTFLQEWTASVKKGIELDKVFISKGNHIMIAYGIIALLLMFAIDWSIAMFFNVPGSSAQGAIAGIAMIAAIYAIVWMVISIAAQRIFGRFTPEGLKQYRRWKAFRNYITDFSAMKEHPPESIVIWERYMVFAIALGVADRVQKNMELLIPRSRKDASMVYYTPSFTTGFHSAYASSTPRSSGSGGGGGGGVGGGFGGGGGGAR